MKFRVKVLLLTIIMMTSLLVIVLTANIISFTISNQSKLIIFKEELFQSKRMYLQDLLSFTQETLKQFHTQASFATKNIDNEYEKNEIFNSYKNLAQKQLETIKHSAGTGYFFVVGYDNEDAPYYVLHGINNALNGQAFQ